MTREDRIEILAQAIWLGMFGETSIRQDWLDYAGNNATAATALRDQASKMLDAYAGATHHSLGWMNG